ncbi:hypothetical protein EV279_1279 [Microbacterium sp. BK668]|nr:hypothetical protein EV279_1279 [Microbacterium sp. BK668]
MEFDTRTAWRTRAGAMVSASAIGAALLFASAPASSAVEHGAAEPTVVKIAPKPDESKGYVIVNRARGVVRGDATFYPTGPISADTMVVITEPDGSLPNGLTVAKLDAIASERAAASTSSITSGPGSDGSATASGTVGTLGTWGYSANSTTWTVATGGTNIGWNASARVSYAWTVQQGTAQNNAGSGLGYYRGYMGSTYGTWAQWYGLGYATAEAAGRGSVPWGNVTATLKFRARCGSSTYCSGLWSAP